MPEVHALRVVAQCGIVVADRLSIVFLLDATESAQLVDADDIRVAADGLGAVALSTGKVVEIVFRHAAIVPRLKEIGLGIDGLIEILDGEDVVLVVECRAPDGHQTVGIVLGTANGQLTIDN